MKGRALVTKSLFSSTQSPKVLGRLGGNVVAEFKGDASHVFVSDRHVEKDLLESKGRTGSVRSGSRSKGGSTGESREQHDDETGLHW